jgi:cobalt-zinc-cadmium efflux system outer membrane protein
MSGFARNCIMLAAVSTLAACNPYPEALLPTRSVVPEGLTSDRDLPRRPWVPELHPTPGSTGQPGYAQSLTLGQAVGRALTFNPAIKAAFLEIEAKHGEEAQASFKPNPELLLEVENFGGGKEKNAFEAAEETLSITQTIELGDKRLRRLRAAHLDASLAGWDYEATRLQTALQAALAYMDTLAAQERLKVLRDFVSIADKTLANVNQRVEGGRASPIDADRAKVALGRARALVKGEEARLDAAKRRLSALWGSEHADFERASGRLGRSRAVPSFEAIKAFLEQNPALARWSDGIAHRVAVLNVERGKAIRDIKIGAGVRRFEEDDSTALVASVSVPLQIFDRNTGAIAAAQRRITKAEHEAAATRVQLVGALVEALGALKVAATLVVALEREVLPAAQTAFDRIQLGYNEGRFDILNVLEAQRSVFEARLDLFTAQAEYEKARVQVEALIGRDLNGL